MTDHMNIAITIREQINAIDPRALIAWGAKNYMARKNSLAFSVGGLTPWKGKVIITLKDNDLYDIRFYHGRIDKVFEDVTITDVTAQNLVDVIDNKIS